MKLQVKRIGLSSYLPPDFLFQEKKIIESLSGDINYIGPQEAWNIEIPTILISNTDSMFLDWNPQEFRQVQMIVHPNSGYDNFSYEFATQAPFPIVLGNPIRAKAVAQYIMSAFYSHFSSIINDQEWKTRSWKRKNIGDLEVLLLGYGHIGKLIEQGLKPFCRNIDIYDPYLGFKELTQKKYDACFVCMSSNSQNYKFINDHFLSQYLKNDGLLVNPARGTLLDLPSLIDFLHHNSLAKAYIDVYDTEPADLRQFKEIPNLLTTTHRAGVFSTLNLAILNFEMQILEIFLNSPIATFKNKFQSLLLCSKIDQERNELI